MTAPEDRPTPGEIDDMAVHVPRDGATAAHWRPLALADKYGFKPTPSPDSPTLRVGAIATAALIKHTTTG